MMEKIPSLYVLWALGATFSLNLAMPIFAQEPKQKKASFAQRINLIKRAREWLKETDLLGKKVRTGMATKQERSLYVRREVGLGISILFTAAFSSWFFLTLIDPLAWMDAKKKRIA